MLFAPQNATFYNFIDSHRYSKDMREFDSNWSFTQKHVSHYNLLLVKWAVRRRKTER